MKVIVPLAGPDFVKPDGSVKAEISVEGLPLLRRALESRSWWTHGLVSDADLVFVEGVMGLFDGTPSAAELATKLGIPILAVINGASMAKPERSRIASAALAFSTSAPMAWIV